MHNTYRFAGVNVDILDISASLRNLCSDYSFEGKPDFSILITRADIELEREKSAQSDVALKRPIHHSSDEQLELLSVYRKMAERMPFYDTFLFHGSCIAVDNNAYLFTAPSGTGKSTHTRLWRQLLHERAIMVNDDKPLIRITDGGAVAYGTPWDGKHHLSNNIAVALKAVCILERAEENHIASITPEEALPTLLQQIYRPVDPEALSKTLTLIDRLSHSVGLYRLVCNMDMDAAELSYNTMKG